MTRKEKRIFSNCQFSHLNPTEHTFQLLNIKLKTEAHEQSISREIWFPWVLDIRWPLTVKQYIYLITFKFVKLLLRHITVAAKPLIKYNVIKV